MTPDDVFYPFNYSISVNHNGSTAADCKGTTTTNPSGASQIHAYDKQAGEAFVYVPPTAAAVVKYEEPQPDGPVAPDGFRHAAKVYDKPHLARGPFNALAVAWMAKDRCVDSNDLNEALYGDRVEELNDSTLRDLRGKLNDFFRAHDIPYTAMVRGHSIAIKDGDPPPRRKKTRR